MIERFQYLLVSKRYCSRELGVYRSYDIVAYDTVKHTVAARARDVTTDRARALYITEMLNRCQLSPVHLADVISDMLI